MKNKFNLEDKNSILQFYLENGIRFAMSNKSDKNQSFQEIEEQNTINQDLRKSPKTEYVDLLDNEKLVDCFSDSRKIADSVFSLDELKKSVELFNGCGLKKNANNTVFSDGNPKSNLMVIGEAPGAQEDQKGIPFCGTSGKLLDKMFLAINVDRRNMYVTNIVFWRPPGNRKPTPQEIKTCMPFLERHIQIISPKLIVLAGGVAASALLKKEEGISSIRGNFFEYNNDYLDNSITTIATFHPSYLLRQPKQKKLAWDDLQSIKKFLTKI